MARREIPLAAIACTVARAQSVSSVPGRSAPGKCGPIWLAPDFHTSRVLNMAKAVTIKVKLVSTADTGFYYVAKKNSRTMTDKLVKKKYDPVARKHVEFRESKIK